MALAGPGFRSGHRAKADDIRQSRTVKGDEMSGMRGLVQTHTTPHTTQGYDRLVKRFA
jgi:hypothetical protein